ncbi:ferrous iron transport protein B [Granulicoccus sp. GXG6511]|uniref:ferrous iron transport protein B n=1 Tax=Granulicoccus sp. GXG6511 TaxID=3381351 RepID=UPI003D7C9260
MSEHHTNRPLALNGPAAVPSCHAPGTGGGAGPGAPVVALAGTPNVGKSTLFNGLTGAKVTVGNWPGTTVEVARGAWRELACTLIDLPGAYSLDPSSPDEALTRALILDVPAGEAPDVVIVATDAAHLARSLYLVTQLREAAVRVVVALTMVDVARHRGIAIDADALGEALGCPVVAVDPRRRSGLAELTAVVRRTLAGPVPAPRTVIRPDPVDDLAIEDERFGWLERAVTAGTHDSGHTRASWSDRIDRVVTAPVLGPLVFLAVMWVVFQITTTVAAPLQDGLDTLFSGPVSTAASAGFAAVGLSDSWVEGLVVDGIIAGVGMLMTFVPLMALMFVLLAMLEDSGYLARAAVVTDRLMRSIGLPGRAFLPLVVGFGCNVPAISATRILPQARQRLLTSLLVPFTACSARLTVFVMLGTIFFGKYAGTAVFAMYVLSIVFVIGVGLLLRKTLIRTLGQDPLVIDLPPYQRPTLRLTAAVSWQRLQGFLRTASGIIVATVVVVWFLQSIPAVPGAGFAEVPVVDSVYGVLSRAIAPIFEPAGFGQWQTVSALVVGFVAKEAVISSWAQTYAVTDPNTTGSTVALGEQITQAFAISSGGHVLPAVAAFMVFLLAYTPCIATLAAQRREIGGRWTAIGVVIQLVVAWIMAVAVFQIGRLFL